MTRNKKMKKTAFAISSPANDKTQLGVGEIPHLFFQTSAYVKLLRWHPSNYIKTKNGLKNF
jgi:hypothetical protein